MGESSEMRELAGDLMGLAVNVGLIWSVMPQLPEHVQEGFTEKIESIREWVRQQTFEVQEFGSAYDEG